MSSGAGASASVTAAAAIGPDCTMSCDHGICACNGTAATDSAENHGQYLSTVAEEHTKDQASGSCGRHGHRGQTRTFGHRHLIRHPGAA